MNMAKQTAAEASKTGLHKGHETRSRTAREARERGAPKAKERWAMLLSGTLTVQELDDDEIRRMRLRSRDGSFSGRARPVPSHIAVAMQKEGMERARRKALAGAQGGVEAIVSIANNPEHKDQFRAAQWLAERGLGKTPDVVRIEGTSEFDRVSAKAVGLDRTVADEAADFLDKDGTT
jgi:hypothetical protein